jgi:hypothetical protein
MRHPLPLCVSATLAASLAGAAAANQPTFFGPLPYASVADSPFFGGGQACYQLETFPEGQVSVPGLTFNSQSGAAIVAGVGVPPGGHVLQSNELGVLQLNLPPAPGGGHPTQVGFVWTGGPNILSAITLDVTSPGGSLATQQFASLPVNPPEDPSTNRFFGVQWSAGIQELRISFSTFPASNQIDDIQFDSPGGVIDAPILIEPTDTIATSTPTFRWQPQACATFYQLWVNDSTGNRIKQWYTAEEVFDAESGECLIDPGVSLGGGSCTWWVRGWSEQRGNGPWSEAQIFIVDMPLTPPVLESPEGPIDTSTPTYTWQPVESATWYQLWVNDSTGNRIKRWYTSAETFDPLTGACSVTPEVTLAPGNGRWWVRAWSEIAGLGPWSDEQAFSVEAAPLEAPALVAPSGTVATATPTYRWQPVESATWYQLWVNDSSGNRIKRWYTAAQVNAASGECSILPTTALVPGNATWWVRGWNPSEGNGPWSQPGTFTVTP